MRYERGESQPGEHKRQGHKTLGFEAMLPPETQSVRNYGYTHQEDYNRNSRMLSVPCATVPHYSLLNMVNKLQRKIN